jgi:hypothetical protein
MTHHTRLFEFLSDLIEVQIKKYTALAKQGVGPDSRLNAALVYNEVNELLGFAEELLQALDASQEDDSKRSSLISIFNQIKFYVEQEHLRAEAGWLLDANNIHEGVANRAKKQLEQLKEIAASASIDFSSVSEPTTAIQRQCQHDSNNIAFFILALARDLRSNPNLELDKIPLHAQGILRKHASSRYQQFAAEIDNLYEKCSCFLQKSTIKEFHSSLGKEDAISNAKLHRDSLKELLNRYQKIEPNSALFASDNKEYKIETAPPQSAAGILSNGSALTKSIFTRRNLLLNGIIFTGGVLVGLLFPYFMEPQEDKYFPLAKLG